MKKNKLKANLKINPKITNPKITAIAVNYNRKTEILNLIDSLSRQTLKAIEIIVVDNCSTDESVQEIQKKFPQVKIVKLAKNMGFSSLNIAMQKAKADIFLLLDNDVEIEADFCQKVSGYFKNNPDVDAVAFRVINYVSKSKRTAPYKPDSKQKNLSGFETTIINGGAGAIKREIFQRIGGYNPDYFIYCNEFEYGARALNAGFDLRYFPDISVRHKEALSHIRKSGKASFLVARNWIYFLYQFIPLKDLIDFMPFSSRIFIENSASEPRKITYYILGVIVGLLTCWKVIPKRTSLSPPVLAKVKGGILGKIGFVYPW